MGYGSAMGLQRGEGTASVLRAIATRYRNLVPCIIYQNVAQEILYPVI